MSSAEDSYEEDYEDEEYSEYSETEFGHVEAEIIIQIPNATNLAQSTKLQTEDGIEQCKVVHTESTVTRDNDRHSHDKNSSTNGNTTSTSENNDTKDLDSSFINDKDTKTRLYEYSRRLVGEGEKHVSLALELDKTRNLLGVSRSENEELRKLLLEGINGGTSDTHSYENIALTHLLRIRIQEFGEVGAACSFAYNYVGHCKKVSRGQSDLNSLRSNPGLHKSEAECTTVTKILNNCDCERMKSELNKMGDRSRRDREVKHRLQKYADDEKCKVNALSDHIEKLMIHLKHEAITKAKALSERSKFQKEIEMFTQHHQIMEKRSSRKDQAINDLKEGGKILEDQLTLMDEKYMALRMKLDWSRNQMEKVFRKKDEEVKELRLQSLIAEKSKKHLVKKHHGGGDLSRTCMGQNRIRKVANLLSVRTKLPSTSDEVT